MSDRRQGAIGGLVFVVLSVLGGATLPKPPAPAASAATLGSYFTGHQHRIELAGAASALAALGLLVLVAHLNARLATDPLAARLVLAGGSVLVTTGVLGGMVQALVAQVADRVHGDTLVLAFGLDRAVFYVAPGFGVILLMAGFARAAAGARLPQWLGGLALLVAAIGLVAGVGQLVSTSTALAAAGFVGFVLTVVWAAATSVTLLREGAVSPAGAAVGQSVA